MGCKSSPTAHAEREPQGNDLPRERPTKQQVADIREMAGCLPNLSRTEPGHTICVHLGWQPPAGTDHPGTATRLLEELELAGVLSLPPKPGRGRGL